MAFQVGASPERVTWMLARQVHHIPDHQLASTSVEFEIPQDSGKNVHGEYVLTGTWIMIHAVVIYKQWPALTPQLLVHEQGHYDIGMLVARSLARDLDHVTGSNHHELKARVINLRHKHVVRNMETIQALYDKETKHGTDLNAQNTWNRDMAAALSQPQSQNLKHHPL
jgi:hypothetical protein